MIEIKDVIHLYLGCEVTTGGWYPKEICERELVSVDISTEQSRIAFWYPNKKECVKSEAWWLPTRDIKPILKPLSSMTEEEKEEIPGYYCPKGFAWLLSHHFDLFNLHEQGLCLYKSDLK